MRGRREEKRGLTIDPLLEGGVLLETGVEVELSSQSQAPGLVSVDAESTGSPCKNLDGS